MKLPKKINIGPYTYKVIYKTLEDCRGKHSSLKQKLYISDTNTDESARETFLHELLHACWWSAQLPDECNEEDAVKCLSIQLSAVFKNNPELKKVFFRMNLNDYQAWVNDASSPRVNELGLAYAGLGLAGETGEVVEKIKKILRDGRLPNKEDKDYIELELGDVLWYTTKLCNILGLSLMSCFEKNVDKIDHRKKYGKPDAH